MVLGVYLVPGGCLVWRVSGPGPGGMCGPGGCLVLGGSMSGPKGGMSGQVLPPLLTE